MKKGFFKLALVSAMAFVCATADAQAQAPQWAQEQATVQQIGPGMTVGAKGWDGNNEILYQIVAVNPEFELVQEEFGETTKSFDYEVKVIGVSPAFASKTGDAAAINILFEDQIESSTGTTTVKITSIEKIECLKLTTMKKPTPDIALTNITKLTVGYSKRANQPEYNQCKAGITSIADGALTGLTGLTDIVTYNTEPAEIKESTFASSLYGTAKLSVAVSENGTVAGKHATAVGWEKFKRLYTVGDEYPFGDFYCVTKRKRIDSNDVSELQKYLSSPSTYTETDKINLHSVNIDGSQKRGKDRLDSNDVRRLQEMINNNQRAY